mgnify:CR=1 FL=1
MSLLRTARAERSEARRRRRLWRLHAWEEDTCHTCHLEALEASTRSAQLQPDALRVEERGHAARAAPGDEHALRVAKPKAGDKRADDCPKDGLSRRMERRRRRRGRRRRSDNGSRGGDGCISRERMAVTALEVDSMEAAKLGAEAALVDDAADVDLPLLLVPIL